MTHCITQGRYKDVINGYILFKYQIFTALCTNFICKTLSLDIMSVAIVNISKRRKKYSIYLYVLNVFVFVLLFLLLLLLENQVYHFFLYYYRNYKYINLFNIIN